MTTPRCQHRLPKLLVVGDATVDGSGQNLERRYRLEVWRETDIWMQSRCSDLIELDRERDAAAIVLEFRLKGVA